MNRVNFVIFCLMFFAVSFGVSAMAALVPSIARYFNVSGESALKLTWLYMLPYGIVALLWSPLTRLVKIKSLFLITAFGFFLSSLLFSLSQSINQAFIFRFLMGVFGCSFVPLSLIAIAKTVSGKNKAKYIGIFFTCSYISTLVSVFLSGLLPWRVIYLIPALLGLTAFILIFKYLDSFDFRKEKFKISYHKTFKDKQAVRFFLVIIVASFLYHALQQRLGLYLSSRYALDQTTISLIFTVSILSAVCFEFWGGFLSSKIGSIKVVKAGFIVMSVFALGLLFVSQYQLIFLIILFWGSGWALTHVGLSSHLAHFPDKILRDSSSLNSALRFSFGGLGAVFGGVLVETLGFNILFIAVGLGVLFLGINTHKIII